MRTGSVSDENNPNLGHVLRDEKIVGFVTRPVGKKVFTLLQIISTPMNSWT